MKMRVLSNMALRASCWNCLVISDGAVSSGVSGKTYPELDDGPRRPTSVLAAHHDLALAVSSEGALDFAEELQVRESDWEIADEHACVVCVVAL